MAKMRNTIHSTIDRANDGTFWCRSEIGKGLYTGCGTTAEEAKESMLDVIDFARADGEDIPSDLSITYKYDIQSFFDFFRWINASEVAKRMGMSPSQMHQYIGGQKKAGAKVYARFSDCVTQIKTELLAASF